MRKLTIVAPALIAAMGLAAALPAQAAPQGRYEAGRYEGSRYEAGRDTRGAEAQIRSDINALNRDIDRAQARRSISNREAAGLKRNAERVQRLYASYARGGLTRTEARTLQNRISRIQVALRSENRDSNKRRG